MENIFDKLNTKQKEAVVTTEGKVRVTAGAGSGKTRVLTHRYAYLVNELGISPSNILCVTFTNKAANEMKKRIATMVSGGNVNDFVCTIHGFCVKFLRKEIFRLGFPLNFSILDEEDTKDLAKQVMEEFKINATQVTVKHFLNGVSFFKKNSPYIEKYMLLGSKNEGKEETERYLQLQLKNFSLDFNDLILYTLYILENFEDARLYWQEKLNYIMVDEAQDFNGTNWRIIDMLSAIYNNLFIVGDPDQAIYEWRGANPNLFIDFKPDTDFILDENYRSTPNILDVANSVIKHNKKRIENKLVTNKENGNIVVHYHGKNEVEESEWIAEQIIRIKESGYNYSDCSILYRASYLSRSIEQALLKKQIKYVVWGGIRFFERKEIKDALAYLKLVANKDELSLRRIVNVPSRRFGKSSMEKVQNISADQKVSLFDALKMFACNTDNEAIRKFVQLVDEAELSKKNYSISDLLDYLLNRSGYMEMLRTDSDEDRLENLEELLNSIKYYEQVNRDEDISIDTYLQDIALYTNADYKNDGPAARLMTIHQAKGLEFPFVFICGLTEGIFPSHRAIRERKENALEEERRLMYVAITRAEKGLFLTESEGYNAVTRSDKYPSRFLGEIADNLINVEGDLPLELLEGTKMLVCRLDDEINPKPVTSLNTGDIVRHKVFGVGKVLNYNEEEDSYRIKFKETIRFLRPSFVDLLNSVEDIRDEQENGIIWNPLTYSNITDNFNVGMKMNSKIYGKGEVIDIHASHIKYEKSLLSKGVFYVRYLSQTVKYRLTWPYYAGVCCLGDFIKGNEGRVYQMIDSYRVDKESKSAAYYKVWSIEENREIFVLPSEIKGLFLPMNNDHFYLVNGKNIWHLNNIEFDGKQLFVWFTDYVSEEVLEYKLTDLIDYTFEKTSSPYV